MAFIPRATFHFPGQAPSWFIGHMQRGLRKMKETLADVDLVLEVRDGRLPLTSINPAFEDLFGADRGLLPKSGKKRLIIYNRRDLAEPGLERPVQRAMLQHAGQLCLFTDTRSNQDVKHVLQTAIKFAQFGQASPDPEKPYDLRFLVAGMPNVGKSSLINALRRVGVNKGKAARTSPEAGMTRKLTGTVRIWDRPPTYIYDTPGVMVPFFGTGEEAIEKGIKLALTSGLKESLYDAITLADYLLFKLNLRYFHPSFPTSAADLPIYLQPYAAHLPTNEIVPLLHTIGTRIGALRKGGEVDIEFAAKHLIRAFREGKLGLWALDDMGLLFKGNKNVAQLQAPASPAVGRLASPSVAREQLLPEPDLEDSLALMSVHSTAPTLITPDSPTSLQISSFIASHFTAQRLASAQLPTSKNQVKKRARTAAADARKEKWRRKHPALAKSRGRSSRTFFVGGTVYQRRLEKKKNIGRKVARGIAKKRR